MTRFFLRHWYSGFNRSNGNWHAALFERLANGRLHCRVSAIGDHHRLPIAHGVETWSMVKDVRIVDLSDDEMTVVFMLATHGRFERINARLGTPWPIERLRSNKWLTTTLP